MPSASTTLTTPRWRLLLGLALLSQLLAALSSYALAGGLFPPLDDVFIHFQYARSLAEGRPFRYGSALDARSSGATSVLYACALAVPYALGARGLALLPVAQLLGALGQALTAEGLYRLGARAHSRTLGAHGAALAFLSAGLLWSAASAMDTIFAVACTAWLFALALELDAAPSLRAASRLALLSLLAPLVRPELASLSLLAAVLLAWRAPGRARGLALLSLLAVFEVPALCYLLTGTASSAGALAKWVLLAPYLDGPSKARAVLANLRALLLLLARGDGIAGTFWPPLLFLLAPAGWLGVLLRLWRAGRRASAFAWCALPLVLLFPATNALFEQHRLRYLWPSFSLLALCVAAAPLELAARWPSRRAVLERWGSALVLVLFGLYTPTALRDLGACARDLRGQHLPMSERLRALPPRARVLVNDAGALAYLGGRGTVDLEGLTTQPLAGLQRRGPAFVLEALEELDPALRPTYAALHRGWFRAPEALLGPPLASARSQGVVTGGLELVLSAFRRDLLGSGHTPLSPGEGWRVVERLDVASLASEGAHGYRCEREARGEDLFALRQDPSRETLDAGRLVRAGERYELAARPGVALRLVLRVRGAPAELRFNGEPLRVEGAGEAPFGELALEVEGARVRARNEVRTRARAEPYGSFHAFVLQR